MQRFRDFLKRKDIEISLRRYGIDALGAMAQGLFCSLLIGTILNTLGQQFHIGFLNAVIFTLGKGEAAVGYTIGGCASLMVGPAMAVAIGHALHAPAMVLFSLVPVGFATNAMRMSVRICSRSTMIGIRFASGYLDAPIIQRFEPSVKSRHGT